MPKKKIIIIGSGIAGLSAGCYLQMNDYDTEIFELHNIPGGLCTAWKRKGWNWLPNLIPEFIKKELPGLENFYLIGQWTTPGGGVSTAFQSGRDITRIFQDLTLYLSTPLSSLAFGLVLAGIVFMVISFKL